MTFDELLLEAKKLKCEEKRNDEDNYLCLVISNDQVEQVKVLLDAYFGPPLQAAGQVPSEDAQRESAAFGGIRQDQTMYFKKGEKGSEVALLWPWGCGTVISVRIIQQ